MTTWAQSQMCVWNIRMFLNATDILHKVHSTKMTSLGFRLPYPLKGRGVSIHGPIHNLYGFHKVQESHFYTWYFTAKWAENTMNSRMLRYLCIWKRYSTCFLSRQNIYIIILDIYDQNMMCVIASKGIRLCIWISIFNNIEVCDLFKLCTWRRSWFWIGSLLKWLARNESM
jgi:hypothetical protein